MGTLASVDIIVVQKHFTQLEGIAEKSVNEIDIDIACKRIIILMVIVVVECKIEG